MASRKAAHAVPFYDSSIPAPLGLPDDVNQLSGLENLSRSEFAPDFIRIDISNKELAQHSEGTCTRSLTVAKEGFRGALGLTHAKA